MFFIFPHYHSTIEFQYRFPIKRAYSGMTRHSLRRAVLVSPELDRPTNCIYFNVYTIRRCTMSTARVFRSGNSQAVRLPKEFRFDSEEVEIFRRGDEVVLREKTRDMQRAFQLLADLPDDFLRDGRNDTPPQRRKPL